LKIFILHTRRTGYGVIRALAGVATEIFGADTFRSEAALSRHLNEFFLIPDITTCSEEQYVELMIDLARRMKYEVERPIVFTAKDDYLLFFSKHYEKLAPYYHLSFENDYTRLNQALDKAELAKVASQYEVLAPRAYELTDFTETAQPPTFPVIMKPAIKNRPDVDIVAKAFRLRICHSVEEVHQAALLLDRYDQPYVIQEYIEGGDDALYTCGVFAHQGQLIAWSSSRKLRQFPPHTGECSLGELIYLPDLVEPCEKLIRAIGLSGIMQIEFKRRGDEFFLIEINPRIWSWHEIHRLVGVNLSEIAVNTILGLKTYREVVSPREERKTWMFLSMDLLHNVLLNRKVSAWRVLCDWWSSDLEAFGNWDDFGPCLEHWKRVIPYIVSQVKASR